jgi:hypothetical protein
MKREVRRRGLAVKASIFDLLDEMILGNSSPSLSGRELNYSGDFS